MTQPSDQWSVPEQSGVYHQTTEQQRQMAQETAARRGPDPYTRPASQTSQETV